MIGSEAAVPILPVVRWCRQVPTLVWMGQLAMGCKILARSLINTLDSGSRLRRDVGGTALQIYLVTCSVCVLVCGWLWIGVALHH